MLQGYFFLFVACLLCQCELYLKLLFNLHFGFLLGFGVLLLELLNFIVFLLLQILQLLLCIVDDLFYLGVDHEVLHLETHFGLETQAAELTLGQTDSQLVIFDGGSGLRVLARGALISGFTQELHDF